MDQSIPKLFNAALCHLLAKEGRGSQLRLATQQKIDAGYLNSIVKGRKSGSDEVRMRIADHFGMTFEDMLALGRRVVCGIEKPGVGGGDGKGDVEQRPPESPRADASGEKVDSRIIPLVRPGKEEKEEALSISEKIRKMVAILESDTTYRDVLAKMIDTFYDAVHAGKDDLASHSKMHDMEKRLKKLEEQMTAANDAARLKSA